jgi:hypothetical protein
MTEAQDAPDGWHWGIGNNSSSHYTYWLYTNAMLYRDGEFGYEAQIYWDKGQQHTVVFYEIEKMKQDGDPVVSPYPCYCEGFDTEDDAISAAIEKATELR